MGNFRCRIICSLWACTVKNQTTKSVCHVFCLFPVTKCTNALIIYSFLHHPTNCHMNDTWIQRLLSWLILNAWVSQYTVLYPIMINLTLSVYLLVHICPFSENYHNNASYKCLKDGVLNNAYSVCFRTAQDQYSVFTAHAQRDWPHYSSTCVFFIHYDDLSVSVLRSPALVGTLALVWAMTFWRDC